MDYFYYKDVLAGFLLIAYILYALIIFSKRYIFKMKSAQIIKIPVSRNTINNILLITLTYVISIPVFIFYFSKGLRRVYWCFVNREDYYLRRQGFFNDDYDNPLIVVFIIFYFFLLIKFILSFKTYYTIRKDNFIFISWLIFIVLLDVPGKGHDIRTFSHRLIIYIVLLFLYFTVRNKLIKDSH